MAIVEASASAPDMAALLRADPDAVSALGLAPDRLSDLRPADPKPVHVTGYYEPELDGSPVRTHVFSTPIHTLPPMGIAASRAEIEARDLLRGHEIAWLRDPVDRFVLQVQGSGRVRFPDGTVLRAAYAGTNGHPYASVGRMLVERGALDAATITADAVAEWLRAEPDRGVAVIRENPSYVMFRPRHGADAAEGPVGTAGVPLTAGRSVAVDPDHVPLGTLLWLDVPGQVEGRLCVAEDTGGAIRGARVDLFTGTGQAAGRAAGGLNHRGRMTVLSP